MTKLTKLTDISNSDTLVFNANTVSGSWHINITEQELRLQRIEHTLEKIADRLVILDKPNKERLEQFKELKKIYKKYKFVDALYGKDKET